MKILLLSPYHAKSHQIWCEGLMANISARWTVLTLPPRYFTWRIRGNSLSWAFSEKVTLQQHFDLIIATSMTDLNGLIGFLPELGKVPAILYFHENQFAYPVTSFARENVEPKIVPLYAALTADHLCFNTQYNYQTFLSGAKKLLRSMPDNVPVGLIEKIQEKSTILPVPISCTSFSRSTVVSRYKSPHSHPVFSIVWNHRWEYDKWPECFFQALSRLVAKGVVFELHVLGEQFKKHPGIFEKAKNQFSCYIKSWGRVEDERQYRSILSRAHIVVSTALHDFQGLAVLEAVAAGCVPVVPDRLAYCELFADQYRYESDVADINKQSQYLADHIFILYEQFLKNALPAAPEVNGLSWANQKDKYLRLFNAVKKERGN